MKLLSRAELKRALYPYTTIRERSLARPGSWFRDALTGDVYKGGAVVRTGIPMRPYKRPIGNSWCESWANEKVFKEMFPDVDFHTYGVLDGEGEASAVCSADDRVSAANAGH